MVAVKTGRAGKRMPRSLSVALSLGLALSLVSSGAQADMADAGRGAKAVGEDAFDLVVLRPTGIVSLLVGSVFFVATVPAVAPYSASQGSIDGIRGSYEVFVYPPYEYTFQRDLGDF